MAATTTQAANKLPLRPIAMRAYQDAIANACDPNDPKKGVREVGGNNRGQAVELYLKMAGANPGDPWCEAFANARYRLAASRLHLEGVSCALPKDLPNTAACAEMKQWAVEHKLWHSVADIRAGRYIPRPGDQVIFDWDNRPGNDHTGICRGWDADESHVLTTEGNTSALPGVSRESNTGDGVWNKSRSLSSLGIGGGVIQIDF